MNGRRSWTIRFFESAQRGRPAAERLSSYGNKIASSRYRSVHEDASERLRVFSVNLSSGSIWFHLPRPRTDSLIGEVQVLRPGKDMSVILSSAPSLRGVGIPLSDIIPARILLRVFYCLPSTATSVLPKPCFIMGRAGKRRGDLPTGDRGHQPGVLGYWIKGLPKWARLYRDKLSLSRC
jgi:hypothetical protein